MSGVMAIREAVAAEWVKLRTVPSPKWLLVAVVAVTAVLGAIAGGVTRCPAAACPVDPAKTSLIGIGLGQVMVVVLAATAISGEYATGMIRITFAAMPHRTAVLAAKAAVTIGPVLRAGGGSVLYLALIALVSLGIAAAVRDTATAIGTVLGLLYVVPIIAAVLGNSSSSRHLQQIAPMTAGLAIQATTGLRSLPISPWAGSMFSPPGPPRPCSPEACCSTSATHDQPLLWSRQDCGRLMPRS
jgi:ABC-2 type transport system permease protein